MQVLLKNVLQKKKLCRIYIVHSLQSVSLSIQWNNFKIKSRSTGTCNDNYLHLDNSYIPTEWPVRSSATAVLSSVTLHSFTHVNSDLCAVTLRTRSFITVTTGKRDINLQFKGTQQKSGAHNIYAYIIQLHCGITWWSLHKSFIYTPHSKINK